MAFTANSLADGQVSNSQAAIYTATAVKAYLKNLTLFNTSATEQTCDLYVKRSGGTARQFKRFVLAQYEHADVIDKEFLLGSGDSIEAVTTTASVLNYYVAGVTEA